MYEDLQNGSARDVAWTDLSLKNLIDLIWIWAYIDWTSKVAVINLDKIVKSPLESSD